MFASDLDAASKAQLTRGARLTELLKQKQFSPRAMEQEVVSVWAGTHGKLDDIPVKDVLRFEDELLDYLDKGTDILQVIRDTEDFTKETEAKLDAAIEDFRRTFKTSVGKPLIVKDSLPPAENPAPVEKEQLVAKPKADSREPEGK